MTEPASNEPSDSTIISKGSRVTAAGSAFRLWRLQSRFREIAQDPTTFWSGDESRHPGGSAIGTVLRGHAETVLPSVADRAQRPDAQRLGRTQYGVCAKGEAGSRRTVDDCSREQPRNVVRYPRPWN